MLLKLENKGFTAFMKTERGFTLIELIVAITIIAILAAVGLVIFNGMTSKAKAAKQQSDVQAISTALETKYDFSKGKYKVDPDDPLQGSDFADGKIPVPSEGGSYEIIFGPDNKSFLVCIPNKPGIDLFCNRSSYGPTLPTPTLIPPSLLTPTPTPSPILTPTPTTIPTNTPTPTPVIVLDQSQQTMWNNWETNSYAGQSFKAGLNGTLAYIELNLRPFGSSPSPTSVTLRQDANINGTILATSTSVVPVGDQSYGTLYGVWYRFYFDNSPVLTAEQEYMIRRKRSGSDKTGWYREQYLNPYNRGRYYNQYVGWVDDDDLVFRVYVRIAN